jgi:hypothetical protein
MREANKTAGKEEERTLQTTVKGNERSCNIRRNHWGSLCAQRKTET